jgi:hypothetical protein
VIVPNYIPEPLEVPGNVAEQPYPLRVRFIRRTTLLFFASCLLVGAATHMAFPTVGLGISLLVFGALLGLLDLTRVLLRGRALEATVAGVLLPLMLLSVAWNLRELQALGLPVWQALVAPACLLIYTLLCGRDYSFMGNYLLSLIASTVGIAAYAVLTTMGALETSFALLSNLALLTYVVYDLAALLSRRRPGEEPAAVADLYRDVLNFPGYFVRVLRHWKKHRIWHVPVPFEMKWRQ